MRISANYLFPHSPIASTQNQKYSGRSMIYPGIGDTVSFGVKVNYGITAHLPSEYQTKVASIHKNITEIKEFFAQFKNKNALLSSKIKKGFPDLIQRKHSGYAFKLPGTDNTVVVMQGQSKQNLLWIYIEDGSKFNGIVMDGNDKVVANVSPNHPHMLPRELHYMNEEKLKEADPKKFIDIAFDKISHYHYYINKLKTDKLSDAVSGQVKTSGTSVKRRTDLPAKPKKKSEKAKSNTKKTSKPAVVVNAAKISKENSSSTFDETLKTSVKRIMKMLTLTQEEFPEHIVPKMSPSGKALGFTVNTPDGGILKVTKVVNSNYGSSMQYLSFEKRNPDNTFNYISIDLSNYSILRTKDKGKPYISANHVVFDLPEAEIIRRNIPQKLESYFSEIFKAPEVKAKAHELNTKAPDVNTKVPEVITTAPEVENKVPKSEVQILNEVIPAEESQAPTQADINLPENLSESIMSGLSSRIKELAQKDAEAAANLYVETFVNKLKIELEKKLADVQNRVKEIFEIR